MAHAEILVSTGLPEPEGVVFEHTIIDSPEAIDEGYDRFMQIIGERRDWLVIASAKRDFEDNFYADIVLRIGPLPFWDNKG